MATVIFDSKKLFVNVTPFAPGLVELPPVPDTKPTPKLKQIRRTRKATKKVEPVAAESIVLDPTIETPKPKQFSNIDWAWKLGWDAADEDGIHIMAPTGLTIVEAEAFYHGVEAWFASEVLEIPMADWSDQELEDLRREREDLDRIMTGIA